jgi:hypothetical protein
LDFAQLLAETEDELEDEELKEEEDQQPPSAIRRRRRGSSEGSTKSSLEMVVRQISVQVSHYQFFFSCFLYSMAFLVC